nr:hypothetical protein [Tanacetum cinerariifolium]
KGKGEVVMSKRKKIKVEDKESFMEDIGFSALHSVNIDTLPNRLARFVVRAFDSKTYNFYLKTGVVYVTVKKRWLSQFASKKKKRIFATDIAEKLVRSTRVDFMFKVNFLILFVNVMGKADTMRAFVNLSVVRRIREDTNIVGLNWCDFIHRCLAISHEPNTVSGFYNGPLCFFILLYLDFTKFDCFPIIHSRPAIKNWTTKNMSTRQYLVIEDEAFGKLDIYGEWSENETVEAEGFCENSSVLPHTDKKKAKVETLLRDANKEFLNDDNVKKLFEQYKGFFKETVLLEETKAQEASVKTKPTVVKAKEAAEKPKPVENVKELAKKPKEPAEKAQEAPQNVKPKPAAVKKKEAAEKPKPAENVKEVAEKPKEPAEKAQEAPQNVKPKPAAVKTKEAAEKPKSAENVKEVAEKPKEPAEKAQDAPQYVNPKPAAVKTKEAVEKPMPAENVKELAKKPKEPAGDDYQVVPAATVMKADDREEFKDELHDWPRVVEPINMVQPSTPKRVFSSPSKGYVKPLGNSLFAMEGDKYETVFQSLGGYCKLSSVRVNMETLAPTLCIDANVIDYWVALLNFEELALGYPTPTRHFFPTGYINQGIIKGTLTEEEQWKSFYDEIKAQFKYEPSSMSLSDFELKKLFSRYLKEQNHSSHEAVAKMRPFIPKLKWRTSNNHVDCGVFAMIHMENYRMRYKIATKIMLHQFNAVSNKMFDFAFTFETKYTEQARVSMIVDAIKNRNNHDPPKQVKETELANVVVGVNEVVDQVKEKQHRKK